MNFLKKRKKRGFRKNPSKIPLKFYKIFGFLITTRPLPFLTGDQNTPSVLVICCKKESFIRIQ